MLPRSADPDCAEPRRVRDPVGMDELRWTGPQGHDALAEDPWERLRTFKRLIPDTPLMMLLRGQSLVGYRNYADDVVAAFVQRAAETGDARLAIELLEDSAKKAERSGRGEIIPDDVRIVAREVGQTVEPNVVENLTLHAQLSLLSLCRRLRKEDEVTTGDAEKLYHVVCEEYEVEPRSHTTFWKHLKTLEQQQLIESRTANRTTGRGRTQHLSMPAALPGTLEKRVEGAIERSVRKARL